MQIESFVLPKFFVEPSSFSQRMKALRKKRGWNQMDLAKALGRSKSYIAQLETDVGTPSDKLAHSLELLEAAPGYDRPPRGDIMRDVQLIGLRYIPVVSWAHAGEAVAFEELPKSWQEQIPSDVKDPKAFAVEVRGDSMEPQIRDGDRVILLPSQEPRNGDIVVVKFKDDGIALKLYHESQDGKTVHLASYNTLYPPRDYPVEAFEKIVPVESVVKRIRF